jgi:hypothetical protein
MAALQACAALQLFCLQKAYAEHLTDVFRIPHACIRKDIFLLMERYEKRSIADALNCQEVLKFMECGPDES